MYSSKIWSTGNSMQHCVTRRKVVRDDDVRMQVVPSAWRVSRFNTACLIPCIISFSWSSEIGRIGKGPVIRRENRGGSEIKGPQLLVLLDLSSSYFSYAWTSFGKPRNKHHWDVLIGVLFRDSRIRTMNSNVISWPYNIVWHFVHYCGVNMALQLQKLQSQIPVGFIWIFLGVRS